MKSNNFEKKERSLALFFLFFPLLLLVTFGLLPILNLFYYSLTSWNGLSDIKEYVGLNNFIHIITDEIYIKVFLNSFYYFISGVLQMIVSIYFAIILSENIKFKSFFKASIVFPTLISGVAISMMFRMFYSPDGSFNEILSILGLDQYIRFWIGDPKIVNYTLAGISFWRHIGFSFIMYLGAIASIPKEYKKVAQLEGASFLQQIRYVILPNIQTVIKLNFILITISSISAFEIPMIMTNGSNGTSTFLLQTMKTAFEKRMFGLAASMAVILALVVGILLILQNKIYRDDINEV